MTRNTFEFLLNYQTTKSTLLYLEKKVPSVARHTLMVDSYVDFVEIAFYILESIEMKSRT